MPGTRVTAKDISTGESDSVELLDDYILITDGKCELTHTQVYANGTHVLTVKRPKKPEAKP